MKGNQMSKQRILIVDDDYGVVRLVSSILRNHDFEVDSATDGLDALVKLKKESFDCVVLDIMMPEVNGYDVCYQLRFNKEYGHIPILILTAREQELNENLGLREDIEYLQKPVDSKLLLDKVQHLLSKKPK
jgi:two-component system OmpR family response regulator